MSIGVSQLVWDYSAAKGGALLVLLALADHANDSGGSCFPSVATLTKKARQCERNVQYNLRVLEKLGEISIPTPGGGHSSNQYQIAVPLLQRRKAEGRKDCTGAIGCTLEVQSAAPQGCNPLHPNRQRTTKESSNKRVGPDNQSVAEDIYQAYPRKVSKPHAISAIKKALKTHDAAFLMERTRAYAKATQGADKDWMPHPATWFNGERFKDDPSTWKIKHGNNTQRNEAVRDTDRTGFEPGKTTLRVLRPTGTA